MMVKDIVVKSAGKKGKGLFATRDFKKSEIILKFDTIKLKKYTLEEIEADPKLKSLSSHVDYIGDDK